MRKFTLLVAALAMFTSFNASAETVTLSWEGTTSEAVGIGGDAADSDNALSWDNGFKLILQRVDKAYSSASKITIDGTEYPTIKLSNGAENILYAPEGNVITKLTIYDYINFDYVTNDGKNKNYGKTPRACYWNAVAGTTYTAENATKLENFLNVKEEWSTAPEKVEFPIEKAAEVSFKNTGEQPCIVLVVEYEAGSAGIDNVIVAEDENAPMYNLQGVQVDENYKGIVIKNGKKFINK